MAITNTQSIVQESNGHLDVLFLYYLGKENSPSILFSHRAMIMDATVSSQIPLGYLSDSPLGLSGAAKDGLQNPRHSMS